MILHSSSLVGQVHALPGFPTDTFRLASSVAGSHQWVHLRDCRHLHLDPAAAPVARDATVALRTCSCVTNLQPYPAEPGWATALNAGQFHVRCAKQVASLEQLSSSWAALAEQDIEQAMYEGPSLSVTVRQSLTFSSNSFAMKLRKLREHEANLRAVDPAAADDLLGALTLLQGAYADLVSRWRTAMAEFPHEAMWAQLSRPYAGTDQLVVFSQGRLNEVFNDMQDAASIQLAVTLSTADVLAHGPQHERVADELLALRVPGFVGRRLHKEAVWSTALPDDLPAEMLQATMLVLDQLPSRPHGGGNTTLDAALAAAA